MLFCGTGGETSCFRRSKQIMEINDLLLCLFLKKVETSDGNQRFPNVFFKKM